MTVALREADSHTSHTWSKTASRDRFVVWLLLAVIAVGALCVVGGMLMRAHRGLDFTDESYYLLWIQDPSRYSLSTTQFGFVYHPLYVLLGESIPALRCANILIIFLLSWLLSFRLLLPKPRSAPAPWRPAIPILSLGLAASGLLVLGQWLLTPSYNSLNLTGLLVLCIGASLARRAATHASVVGWVLMGVGTWLTFMAKPTTAAVAILVVLLALVLQQSVNAKGVGISAFTATGLLVASALWIDGSLGGFLWRLGEGGEAQLAMDPRYEISSLALESGRQLLKPDWIYAGMPDAISVALLLALMTSTAILLLPAKSRVSALIGVGLTIAMAAPATAIVLRPDVFPSFEGKTRFYLVLGPVLGALAVVAGRRLRSSGLRFGERAGVLPSAMLAMPFVFAFGSTNELWFGACNAAIFWFAGAASLLGGGAQPGAVLRVLPVSAGALLVSAVVIAGGIQSPYRQPGSIDSSMVPVQASGGGSSVELTPVAADYVNDLRSAAAAAGFERGMGLIDLTGSSPGASLLLGAVALGNPWLIGGYPGSSHAAEAYLSEVACPDLASAWLLLEPEGRRSLSMEVLEVLGARHDSDYLPVAWATAPSDRRLILLRPDRVPEEAVEACTRVRDGRQTSLANPTDTG